MDFAVAVLTTREKGLHVEEVVSATGSVMTLGGRLAAGDVSRSEDLAARKGEQEVGAQLGIFLVEADSFFGDLPDGGSGLRDSRFRLERWTRFRRLDDEAPVRAFRTAFAFTWFTAFSGSELGSAHGREKSPALEVSQERDWDFSAAISPSHQRGDAG